MGQKRNRAKGLVVSFGPNSDLLAKFDGHSPEIVRIFQLVAKVFDQPTIVDLLNGLLTVVC
jgi:hypothetical protein